MLPTFSAGFYADNPTLGAHLPHEARTLLDQGLVLGFRYTARVEERGWSCFPKVMVALSDTTQGVRWVEAPHDVFAAQHQVPGLVYACFALTQTLHEQLYLYNALQHWDSNYKDHGMSYAEITITKDGYILGEEDPSFSMDDAIEELEQALEEEDLEAPIFDTFDMARIVTIVLPRPNTVSAHTTVALYEQAQLTFAQWQRLDTTWDDKDVTPTVTAPSLTAVQRALR